jgi:5-methyltetrahydropteroyltriglutamate--homocysteine methyltransferase
MVRTHILGYPRIGAQRELKFAQEAFWKGESSEAQLREVGRRLRSDHWRRQRDAGLDMVTCGDFAWYDQTLTLTAALGALPARFGFDARGLTLQQYFELARGNASQPAMEMTKWFDTNYHYLVPELAPDTRFDGGVSWLLEEVDEALALGHHVKPVILGPLTYLWLSKCHGAHTGFDRLSLLPRLVQAYRRILSAYREKGIEWVQIDEPALCLDLPPDWLAAYQPAYEELRSDGLKLLLATYFDTAGDHAVLAATLPVQGFHIDLVRAPHQLEAWQAVLPVDAVLSVGVIDGRNIWRHDPRPSLALLGPLHAALGDRLWVAPSCSLQHVPVSLDAERRLDPEIRSWLAFASEKLDELHLLRRALNDGEASVANELRLSDQALHTRRVSGRVTHDLVQNRLRRITPAMACRQSPFAQRIAAQQAALQLPPLPTTTIGSFPQTAAIRQLRAAYKRGEIQALDYLERIRAEIETAVRKQEALGLDVLVHGEAERNDMVEYFGEQLWGYAFTENGWVQSYGSRCVKPPIIYGDVFRPEPMTVETIALRAVADGQADEGHADRPGDDAAMVLRARRPAARSHGVATGTGHPRGGGRSGEGRHRVIQIDEPAFREGLPLRRATGRPISRGRCAPFKISAAGVRDETQIHTHMCYSEFNDILPCDRGHGCRRDHDRDLALGDGAARRFRRVRLSQRHRAGCLRHPLAARAQRGGHGEAAGARL